MSNILHAECADGQILPYLGYIQCSLNAKGIDNDQVFVDGLFLIVLNTTYNRSVFVLIGMNIISVLMNIVKNMVPGLYNFNDIFSKGDTYTVLAKVGH